MLKIKMYPAQNGDAFLIRSSGKNVLVDCGYASTFEDSVAADLHKISASGERLNLLVVTHIDSDHIGGVIALLEENGPNLPRNVIEIDEIWHNSLRCIQSTNVASIPPPQKAILDSVVRRGYPLASASGAKQISAKQGSNLATAVRRSGYSWNGADGTSAISRELPPYCLGGEDLVRVIGPSNERLGGLSRWWLAQLRKLGYQGPTGSDELLDEAFELICAHAPPARSLAKQISVGAKRRLADVYEPDTSVTNGSSIATVLEVGGVRLLFLGDAWAEDIVDSLVDLRSRGHSLLFDAIKISHHGSLRNTSPALLDLIDAPMYFVSSSGALHDHPDFEVLAAIVDRPAPFARALYFNYATDASARLRGYSPVSDATFSVIENATSWIEVSGGTHD
ncbi:AVAST type 1 anti-phage system MBL fold metallo-hydrolase Avs1a [Paraburkholderia bannensis]|uniref:AVAST type 1 anti-phage system MBL fold metallo-hydrolase Avs1a n=1 Tax=Paraburkholderia bannensis TaxID=765414 RepID=UPI002ABD65E7|nr:AVAST type 1 anti-phage system MBL fold metallo-hydrolase Avs1a [Paraburkholderia bannensis]